MKKRKLFLAVIALSVILLTGCGSSVPEDVAETFVKALSSANIDDAKEVSTKKVQDRIDDLVNACNRNYYRELTDESVKAFRSINNAKNPKEIGWDLESKKSDVQKDMNDIKELLTKKYGNLEQLSYKKRQKVQKEAIAKIAKQYLEPMIRKALDKIKIDIKHKDEVSNILSQLFISNPKIGYGYSIGNTIYQIVENGNFKKMKNVTSECVAKYTNYGFVDDINFIELNKKSADKMNVRLELIDNNDNSNKVSIPVEKIKDEWKVSYLSFK